MKTPSPLHKRLTLLVITSALLTACGGGGDDLLFIEGVNDVRPLKDELEDRASEQGDTEVVEEEDVLDDIEVVSGTTTVFIPGRSLLDIITVDVASATLSTPIPAGFTQVGDAISVTVPTEHQELLNGPVSVTMQYNPASVSSESSLMALYFDGTDYHPLTILARDEQANTITFETRRFPTLVLAESTQALAGNFDTGFDPALNGWAIDNFGSYFAPDGNSFGMSGYAAWFYGNGAGMLNGLYLEPAARIAAARVQMSQAETWGSQSWRDIQNFKPEDLARILRAYLSLFDTPLVLMLGQDSVSDAVMVYGYDANGFYFYDPDAPGQEQFISFSGTAFGKYAGADVVGFATLASFGRNSDFAALSQEAEAGFPGSENLAIDSPTEGEQINARDTTLSGSLLNDLSEETDLYVEIKGVGRQLSLSNSTFSNVIEISSGVNTIVALAGVDSGTENNWFKDAPTVIREVEGTLPPARLLVTLTWEQNETDVDLYIIEPEVNGSSDAMWFGGRETNAGLELDFDDTTGFGPEHGTLEVSNPDDPDPDQTLEGEYIVRVHYYSDDGLNVDATGRVTIVINEGAANQSTLTVRFRISDSNASQSGPTGTGSSWVNIAKVDVINNIISTDFTEQTTP
jgi:Uncharacterized protein conserved in bacteria (DUF2135)